MSRSGEQRLSWICRNDMVSLVFRRSVLSAVAVFRSCNVNIIGGVSDFLFPLVPIGASNMSHLVNCEFSGIYTCLLLLCSMAPDPCVPKLG